MPTFPKPDRSNQRRNFTKTADNDAVDVGYCEGQLSDGRPFVAELWAQDQVTALVIFFSRQDLDLTDSSAADLIEREGLARLGPERGFCSVREWTDPSGAGMWSVNFVVGDDESTYVHDALTFRPYPK